MAHIGFGSVNTSTDLIRSDDEARAEFAQMAAPVLERHRRQSAETVAELRRRYAKPVFGKVRVWDLIMRLGACVDPTDQRLFCASQLVHVSQILDEMERDDVASPEMVLVALVHDLGKLLLLTGEDPANVVCMNEAVGDGADGAGLDQSLLQWNHDEFAYQRLVGHIPDDLAWLVRYHSIEIPATRRLMDAGDLERTARLLEPFAHYDHGTKSPYYLPPQPLDRYRSVVEAAFPRRLTF
jgi:hypothetical protein